ncbi:polyprenyl synthetase family protein [bacterium]|nr:MAG: polyprenyl synthetase family protein [bacterium]RIK64321.1 MAG: farnesyl-diphosphate synthase [Planctomycetota bacterium]
MKDKVMSKVLQAFMQQHRLAIETELERRLPRGNMPQLKALDDAMEHALFTGGKRMRPVLCLASASVCGFAPAEALKVAAALEFLHSASLIFDDLPCMDCSLERRGEDTVHVKFGEGVAVLAGLALLNETYALLAQADGTGALMGQAAQCIGARGMIAGQCLDLRHERAPSLDDLEAPYLKTTALLKLSLVAAPLSLGAPGAAVEALALYGQKLGMAYQLLDDELDQDESTVAGADLASVLGKARAWIEEAKGALAARFGPGPARDALCEFAESVWARALQDVRSR